MNQQQCHHHGQNHNQPVQYLNHSLSFEEYFDRFKALAFAQPVLFIYEICSGAFISKIYEKLHLNFLNSIDCQMLIMVITSLEQLVTFNWMPFKIRPFLTGLFIPYCFLLYLNLLVISGSHSQIFRHNNLIIIDVLSIIFYFIVALRGSGNLNTPVNRNKSLKALQDRPYLQSPTLNCNECKILKVFRSVHCPICRTCIPKFSTHSFVFGVCIGACNQLFVIIFMFTAYFQSYSSLLIFFEYTNYGFLTKLVFSCLNLYIGWASLCEFFKLFLLNIYFGITENEIRSWTVNQYLMNVPEKSFLNNCDNGLVHNFKQSMWATFGKVGYEQQSSKQENIYNLYQDNQSQTNNQQSSFLIKPFQKLRPFYYKKYIINWGNAFFFVIPQMPNHKIRNQVIKMMQKDQPRMIELYKIQKIIKKEVEKEIEQQGLKLNDFQKHQRISMKMQQHLIKNSPAMDPDQQKKIQLQMLGHMKKNIEKQFADKCEEIQNKLEKDQMTVTEVGVALRQIQSQLMAKKMKKVIQEQEKKSQKPQNIQNQV